MVAERKENGPETPGTEELQIFKTGQSKVPAWLNNPVSAFPTRTGCIVFNFLVSNRDPGITLKAAITP